MIYEIVFVCCNICFYEIVFVCCNICFYEIVFVCFNICFYEIVFVCCNICFYEIVLVCCNIHCYEIDGNIRTAIFQNTKYLLFQTSSYTPHITRFCSLIPPSKALEAFRYTLLHLSWAAKTLLRRDPLGRPFNHSFRLWKNPPRTLTLTDSKSYIFWLLHLSDHKCHSFYPYSNPMTCGIRRFNTTFRRALG